MSAINGEALHWRVMRHCRANGIPETTFGRRVANDPRLVRDLRAGRMLRPATLAKVVQAMGGTAQ